MFNAVWRPIQRGIGLRYTPLPPPRSPWGLIKKILNDWALAFCFINCLYSLNSSFKSQLLSQLLVYLDLFLVIILVQNNQ
jgi:hypothetical protein